MDTGRLDGGQGYVVLPLDIYNELMIGKNMLDSITNDMITLEENKQYKFNDKEPDKYRVIAVLNRDVMRRLIEKKLTTQFSDRKMELGYMSIDVTGTYTKEEKGKDEDNQTKL